MRKLITFMLILTTLVLTACGETGDTSEDAGAAQSFIPSPSGYAEHETDDIQNAIAGTIAGASGATGNIPAVAVTGAVEGFVDCYRDVGAFDARLHIQNINLSEGLAPTAGVVGVINQSRVLSNFVSCANPMGGAASAQGLSLFNPCANTGSFTAEGESFSYFYAATNTPLCQAYAQHFAQYGG
jgi:hypothetical protein